MSSRGLLFCGKIEDGRACGESEIENPVRVELIVLPKGARRAIRSSTQLTADFWRMACPSHKQGRLGPFLRCRLGDLRFGNHIERSANRRCHQNVEVPRPMKRESNQVLEYAVAAVVAAARWSKQKSEEILNLPYEGRKLGSLILESVERILRRDRKKTNLTP